MEQKQLETIVGLITGLETAVVHLANIVAKQANLDPQQVADSFIETAVQIPNEVRNRELLQLVLRHIAGGIRQSSDGADPSDSIRQLLH